MINPANEKLISKTNHAIDRYFTFYNGQLP